MKAATFQLDEVLLTRLNKEVKKRKKKDLKISKQKIVAIALDKEIE